MPLPRLTSLIAGLTLAAANPAVAAGPAPSFSFL
jgi:hypothetical protein